MEIYFKNFAISFNTVWVWAQYLAKKAQELINLKKYSSVTLEWWKVKKFRNFAACYLYMKSLRIYVCRLKNGSSRLILVYLKSKILHISPEMELFNSIFSRGFCAGFSDLRFCLVFYPNFFVLQNAIHEKTQVFLFRRFFCKDF